MSPVKTKKRSPEAIYEAKSARRSEIDGLRKAQRRGRPEERAAASEALRQIDGVSWPVGLFDALNGPYDDSRSLDTVLRFLEDDPYRFGSGYLKEVALRRLGRWTLVADDRRRIAGIVLNAVDGPTAREFRRQCKAARHADRAILTPDLLRRLDSPNESLRQRAYCAAVGMLEDSFSRSGRYLPREEIRARIAAMRERLRLLQDASTEG